LVLPAFLLSLAFLLASLSAKTTDPSVVDEALLDIKKVDPTIVVDLRYAGVQNIAGRALYPPEMPALVRPGVALRLVRAQNFLRSHHYGLKIWDAYRPPLVQNQLWQLLRNASYIANPTEGRGSLHTWGVAVDATLVDEKGEEVAMPTDFDAFTPDARLYYHGNDRWVNFHLKLLQTAMRRGGFYGLRTEWWHFIAYDWKKFGPIGEIKLSSQ
jgi:zinc D-Ala-D-Ala dipeptidase